MPSIAEVLQAASLALTRTLDLETVLETLLDSLAQLVPYDSANVMLAEEGSRLRVRAQRGYESWADPSQTREIAFDARTNPIVESIFRTRSSVLIRDTRAEPGWQRPPGAGHVLCWIGVPLPLADSVTGIFSLDKAEAGFFTEEHLRLAESLAPHAAMAIANTRLLARERGAREEAERLQSAARSLAASLDPQEVFAAVLRELQALIPYDSAAVMELRGGQLQIVGGHGFRNLEDVIGVSFDLSADNPNREVVRSLAPLILEDAPARYPAFRSGPHAATPIRSWLGVPLLFGGRPIGMLALDKERTGFFTDDHARLAASFAAQAAIAMENARLFDAARRELAEREKVEARHRAFVEEAPYGLVAVDRDQRIVLVNRVAERLFGYERAEVLRQPVERLVPEGFRGRLRELLASGSAADASVRPVGDAPARLSGLRKDGGEFPMDASLGSLEIDGEPVVVAAVLDVTERARAEEALRERTQQLELALEATRMGVWHLDLLSDAVTTIQGGGPISGLPEDLYPTTGEAFYALVHPDDRPLVAERLRAALERGETYQAEFRIVLPDRSVRWVAAQGRCSRNAEGRPTTMIGVDLDITERKRAENELRGSETRYRGLFLAHPLPMWVYDLETLRFLAVNDAATLAYGWSREEFLAITLREIRPVEDLARLEASVAESRARPGYERSEQWRHVTRDGRVREVEIASHDIVFEGRPARIVAVHDVTEKRELEAQIRQSQKLEAVGRLAGGIAHDFNNMLGVILGFAELALKRLDPDGPVYHHIERIVQAAERSAGLTRQLLAFARRQTIAPRVLDLNAEIASLATMLGRLVGEDVRLELIRGEGLWRVKLDPTQLGQVLANLATNARDAIEDVGSITIETSNVTLDESYCRAHAAFAPGQYVRLVVSDSGSGMDARTRDRIFEPFFTTKPEGHGTGLGLATVFGIVTQNGGFIDVQSEPGHGTTFQLYLPRCAGEPEAEAGSRPAALGGRETLLLVEDEPQLLELTREGLEQLGYAVLSAACPVDALELCEKHAGRIDLLVTDVVMPGMNGKQLCDRLQRLRPGLRVLFMSGYTADAIANRGVLEEGVRFIEKPFSLDALAAKVRGALEDR